MRIGIDGLPLAEPRTGIGHYTFELANALARVAAAYQFELLSPVPLTALGGNDQRELPANLNLVRTKINSLWWTMGLPLHILQAQLSIFHGTNYEIPLWNRCPTVVTIHDLSVIVHAEAHPLKRARRARHRLPFMARAATRIITASESVKREISEHLHIHPDKIAVTPYAARRNFRPLPLSQTQETRRRLRIEEQFILFVGTIEPRKNLITLVRAFAELMRNTELRPQLVIVGRSGWLMEETFACIRASGISDRLLFTGYISEDELCALYSSCLTCVYPSLYEGFGLPPLEAMACGAPVITSRIPSIMETTGTAACLIVPTDVQELAQSIINLLTDANRRRYLRSAGLQRAAEFTWKKTARLTLGVYREALNRKKNGQSLSGLPCALL